MTHRSNFPTLAALLLCGAMLAGCGGGDAEAPPPPVGPTPPTAGPDTTPPSVTIASDVSASTATGPVTFTFVFSEDVGVSFDGTDIVVTGGTPGTFTRVSGTQATLVVTPPANSAGTMSVSVAAAKFTDIAGNANTAAATGSKAFDVRLPTAPTTAAPTPPARAAGDVLSVFSDAYAPIAGIDLNPNWGQSTVPSTVTVAGNATRKYATLNYQGIDWSANPINVSTMTRLHIDVWTPDVTSILVSIISAGAENPVTLTPTLAGWNSFDIDLARYTVPNKAAIIQIKIEGTPAGGTLFFDNLYFWKPAGGGGSSTALITFDEATAPKLTDFGVNGAPPVIATDPAGGTNKVLKVFKYKLPAPGSEQWAGVTVSTGANDSIPAIPFTASAKTITVRVYSPAVGVRVRMKVENAANPGISVETDALTTTSGAWETLTFNFANPALNPPVGGGPTAALDLAQTYNKLSIFSDFGIGNGGSAPLPADRIYYYDDISFVGAVSGGGGGSGTVLANFDTVSPPIAGFEGAEGSAVEAGPTGGSGNALKVLRSGGQVFALAIVTLPSNIPLEATRKTVSARVYSPTAGIPMVLKLEGPGGNPSSGDVQANETVVVGWQTLTWTINAVNTNYNVIVLLPNLGSVDAPPGKAYYFDDITLLGTASGGGGGGSASALTFSTGFAAGNRTVQGGEFGGFSGSNQDNFACSGDPAWCGGGGDITPAVAAADSFFFYYYQTPTPATALYMGIFVLAPGVSGGLSNTADSPGVQINGQTSVKFKLGQNAEWFGTATNKFAVDLTLGKRYVVGGNTCRVQLRKIVTPTAAAASVYTVALSGFSVVQDCAQGGLTVASALAASPISQVSFQGVGGSIALTAGGQTSGANLSVAVNGKYPTTLVLAGGISFEP